MKKYVLLCLMWVLSARLVECQVSIAPNTKKGDSNLQLTIELNSKWSALNSCRNADLLVTYRNNSEKPVMIVSPDNLHLKFQKGNQIVTKFDGFTYETNIFLWGVILSPKSEYCTKVPLRLFLNTKVIVPGEWNVSVNYREVFEKEWVGSEFGGEINYIEGKKVERLGRLGNKCSIISDEKSNHHCLVVKKDFAGHDRIEIISGTLVSNSRKLIVERCGWMEKFFWRIKTWFSQW